VRLSLGLLGLGRWGMDLRGEIEEMVEREKKRQWWR